MGRQATKGVQCRERNEMAICDTCSATSERLCRISREEHQDCAEKSNRRADANTINQCPIGRVPNDPDDGSYLCPNYMLLGRASSTLLQGPFRETNNPRHRAEFVQKIVDSFWRRWTRDVFPSMVPRKKWNVERRNVRVDNVVIVQDPNAVRGKWTIGRVSNVYPGRDGRVRNVKLKTATAEYQRPTTKIVVIYLAEGYED